MNRPPAHAPIAPRLRGNAKRLRSGMTDAERRFWHAVRANRFHGLVFRRQVPIAGYIADFVCHDVRLIVEIDGGQHSTDSAMYDDAVRTARLAKEGYRLVRFWNHDIVNNLDGVLTSLRATALIANMSD
jgi:very-short-patch-repair endonuclease